MGDGVTDAINVRELGKKTRTRNVEYLKSTKAENKTDAIITVDKMITTIHEIDSFMAEVKKEIPVIFAQINNIENDIEGMRDDLNTTLDSMTLNTMQQDHISLAVHRRVCQLVGGENTYGYKHCSRSYKACLWYDLKKHFGCGGTYRDLNPKLIPDVLDFINSWDYTYEE